MIMIGPGKYDQVAQRIQEELKAKGVVLLVIAASEGSGMSVKADPLTLALLPQTLHRLAELIADQIPQDLKALSECPPSISPSSNEPKN